MKAAEKRKKNDERRVERKVQKERELEVCIFCEKINVLRFPVLPKKER